MIIKLKERKIVVLEGLKVSSTFKISENNLVFMKIDVEGLTVFPKQLEGSKEEIKLIKVQVPEGKVPVLCLQTGITQYIKLDEKVEVVELETREVLE